MRSSRAAVFFILLFSYAYFFGGSGFNQNATFDLARSLVERQSLNIDPYVSNTADVSFHEGHAYSNKAPGLAFAAAVPYALLYAMYGAPDNALELNLFLYACTVVVCGVSGALIGVLLCRYSPLIALLVGFGTPVFAYSTMLFAHVPAALCVLLAYLLLKERRDAAAGAAIGAAVFINYLCAPLAVLMLFFAGRKLRYLAGGLPFAIALAAYQLAAFGSPFRTSIETMNPAFIEQGALLGIFHLPRLDALWGITFSPYRGLFYLSPILLLALAGLRDRLIWIAFGVLLLLNASFNGWHGGYAVGARYLIPVIPLLAIGLKDLLHARIFLIAASAISILFNVAVTVVDPQPPDSLQDPVGRYAIPALVTGRAVPDEKAPWLAEL
ncbi:MAG: hypothetical protein ACLGH0_07000, partial [Thermoanaerobaculia bacterium]